MRLFQIVSQLKRCDTIFFVLPPLGRY